MSFIESIREAIESRLIANWIASGTTLRTPIAFETVDKALGLITTSDGGTVIQKPPNDAPWMRCTIRHGAGEQKDLVSPARVRQLGRIYLDVFAPLAPPATGAPARATVDTLVDLAVLIFDRQTFGGVMCRAAAAEERGQDKQWWWSQVTVPFRVERLSS